MARIKYSPLYLKAKKELIKMIRKGDFKNNKLPPEDKLSEMLGISRSTIREALITLDRECIITKKQGVGNLIHKNVLETKMRIDVFQDFLELLEDGGYKATVKRIKFEWIDDISQFNIKIPSLFKDKEFFLSQLLYFADNHPAILATNCIPKSVLSVDPQVKGLPFSSFRALLNFLGKYTQEEISHSINKYSPDKVDQRISKILKIKCGESIIKREEYHCGIFGKLLCYSEIAFHPKLVSLSMVNKWN